jgi:tRNA threonylcarbamoyl adenosine modification protein YeaZ
LKNFLAVDTSSEYLTVVACKDGKVESEFIENCSMRHSVTLMNAIDGLLARTGWLLEDFEFFSAVVGAGSFTGIRIGISAIKGFCLALNKPALPVTSFDVCAYNSVGEKAKRLCLVDALHDCYYACGYDGESIVYEPEFINETEVLALKDKGYELLSCSNLPVQEKTEVKRCNPVQGLVNAVRKLSEQGKFGELSALYVRKSSAELNLKV